MLTLMRTLIGPMMIFAISTILSPTCVVGKEIYVATSGIDSNSRFYSGEYASADELKANPVPILREAFPLQTVKQALAIAQPGDQIYLRGGTYTETIVINKSGNATHGAITIASYPGEAAIFTRKDNKYRRSSIYAKGVSYVTITKLTFDDCYYDVIYFEGPGEHVSITGNTVRNQNTRVPDAPPPNHRAGHAIRFKGFTDAPIAHVLISDNLLEGNHTGHPQAYDETLTVMGTVTDVVIANNRLIGNDFIGIDLIGKTVGKYRHIGFPRDVLIKDNYVTGNGIRHEWAAGIYVDGADTVTIEGNTVISNNGPGIAISQEQQGDFVENIVVRNNVVRDNKYNILVGPSLSDEVGGRLTNIEIRGNLIGDAKELGEVLIMDAFNVRFLQNRFTVGRHGILARFYTSDKEQRDIRFEGNCLIEELGTNQKHASLEKIRSGVFRVVPNETLLGALSKCD